MAFSHENLRVYQKAIAFVAWTHALIETLPRGFSAKDQLERASTSVALNLAEGNAKFSHRDRGRFWQIAHGSAVECAACLDVLVARKAIESQLADAGKGKLEEIVRMILALLDGLGQRFREDESEYGAAFDPLACTCHEVGLAAGRMMEEEDGRGWEGQERHAPR
ncbi:MAG: four helix bundle protein [Verrucomicrobiae bacterium]|nr:four helix bundle protein [Verrucomicrobiae bacterium]